MPPSSLYCCHKSVSMISAAARNRRMSASPFVRLPFPLTGFAARVLANNPALIIPAPATSDLPKKERRPIEPSVDLSISDLRITPLPRFPSNVLPSILVSILRGRYGRRYSFRYGPFVRACDTTSELMLAPSLEIESCQFYLT